MNSVTQDMRFRQSLLKYSQKYGVTKAAIKYKTNRQYIYRWLKRYDGTLESLREKSRRPHHHPNQHTEDELKLIRDMRRRNPGTGLVVLWVKLRQRGYTRTVTGLYRVLRRNGEMAVKPKNPKYIPKPYEQMNYPGERVQMSNLSLRLALWGQPQAEDSISIPLSMSFRATVILKLLKKTVPIPLRSFSSICSTTSKGSAFP